MKTIPWDEIRKRHFTPKEIEKLDAAIEAELQAMSRRSLPARLKKTPGLAGRRPIRGQK